MKRPLLNALLIIVAALFLVIQIKAENVLAVFDSKDEEAIKVLMRSMADIWSRHDATAMSMVYAEDADFTTWRGDTRLHGREEIRNAYAPFFAGTFSKSKLTVTGIRIRLLGPAAAAVHCDWELEGVMDSDGKMTPASKYIPLFVLSKKDGKWEIVVGHLLLIQPAPPKDK